MASNVCHLGAVAVVLSMVVLMRRYFKRSIYSAISESHMDCVLPESGASWLDGNTEYTTRDQFAQP